MTLDREKEVPGSNAIRNAKNLEKIHDPRDKLNNNPSTTVYKLVEALNELIDDCN